MDYKPKVNLVNKPYNRLILEKSPYLLQHAYNPVDWFPWGSEAFAKAQEENKPIFLSIGYSTCHWCHVMEKESFEDPEVARLMNEVFVAIKVDREERPDIDSIYMNVCQMMTGSGGWPLTIIMTPDKQPFFAATYIPKIGGLGRIGMLELIPRIKELWQSRKQDLIRSGREVTELLLRLADTLPGEELREPVLRIVYEQLSQSFDATYGGFSPPPKFPSPHQLFFLLRYWKRMGEVKALGMVETTLQAMRRGGIYDHLGFGFHRYSTDRQWLVPHFEKMLYDQAMLAMAYTEAYQATGKEEYRRTAQEIFTYVSQDMTVPGGGFYSAEDADSEEEEGKYYLWLEKEVREVLTKEEAEWMIKVFNINEEGNFSEETGEGASRGNILYLKQSLPEIATELGVSEKELQRVIAVARQKLLTRRNNRIPPQKDDKVLTDWNGLMIAALAKGAQAFNESQYAHAASRAAEFILKNLRSAEGGLYHRYRAGEAAVPGFLDDYVFFIWGLIELYETTFEISYLQTALNLNQYLFRYFWDDKNGGFYFTRADSEDLLVRKKEIYDAAVPSGNSVAMLNLVRLARMTGDNQLEEKAGLIGRAFSREVLRLPAAHTQLMVALDFLIGPSYEVVIVGKLESDHTKAMLKILRGQFLPNKIVLVRPPGEGSLEITRIAKFTKDYTWIDGRATAYICYNHRCYPPLTDTEDILRLLQGQ
jgi:hypothetical protein